MHKPIKHNQIIMSPLQGQSAVIGSGPYSTTRVQCGSVDITCLRTFGSRTCLFITMFSFTVMRAVSIIMNDVDDMKLSLILLTT